jgi:hypothetical protein
MIFPIVLYGCETWTKTKATEDKVDACEMLIWRKLLGISWTETRTYRLAWTINVKTADTSVGPLLQQQLSITML